MAKINTDSPVQREGRNRRNRRWLRSNPEARERRRLSMAKWRKKNIKRRQEYNKAYKEIKDFQHRAMIKVAWAIKSGKLTKRPCRCCGSSENIIAHHCDYNKPLDVMWLCPRHHATWHRIFLPIVPVKIVELEK